jgi:hypothetical protein
MEHSPSTQNAEAEQPPATEPAAQTEAAVEKTEPASEAAATNPSESTNDVNSAGQADQVAAAPKKEVRILEIYLF